MGLRRVCVSLVEALFLAPGDAVVAAGGTAIVAVISAAWQALSLVAAAMRARYSPGNLFSTMTSPPRWLRADPTAGSGGLTWIKDTAGFLF